MISRRAVAISAPIVLVLLALVAFIVLRPAMLTREQYLALDYFSLETPKALVPFTLTTHTGAVFDKGSLEGHWSLLFFGYTYCPDVCPTTLSVLKQAMAKLREDGQTEPRVYLVTVDPDRDTREQLASYVTFFDPAFTGVTGDLAEITRLATDVYVPFGKVPGGTETNYLVDHGAGIIAIDPRGEFAGFFRPPPNAENMARVLHALQSG